MIKISCLTATIILMLANSKQLISLHLPLVSKNSRTYHIKFSSKRSRITTMKGNTMISSSNTTTAPPRTSTTLSSKTAMLIHMLVTIPTTNQTINRMDISSKMVTIKMDTNSRKSRVILLNTIIKPTLTIKIILRATIKITTKITTRITVRITIKIIVRNRMQHNTIKITIKTTTNNPMTTIINNDYYFCGR
jgi:hypothetical protein